MICLHPCDECIHIHEKLVDGWKPACDAFPEGIPDSVYEINVTKLKECNNGIKYELNPKYKKWHKNE